ncbi:MAG: universal stress protein [Flavobacteriales bacterium]
MPHIVIATDFSDNSLHAAEYAVALLGPTSNRYTLLHACTLAHSTMPIATPELLSAAREQLGEFTGRFRMRTGADDVREEVHFGNLPAVVNDLSKEEGAQLVVVGNRGRTGTVPFGSNAVHLIQESCIPVLAVPGTAPIKPVERILLADDYGDILPRHLEVLRSIATLNRSEVLVVHEGIPIIGSAPTWRKGTYGFSLRDIKHSFHDVLGKDVVEGLDRLAHTQHADMVAVVHRHIGAIGRLFHPSTAKELARHADLPLLVLQDTD